PFVGQNSHHDDVLERVVNPDRLSLDALDHEATLDVGTLSSNVAAKYLQIDPMKFQGPKPVMQQLAHRGSSGTPPLHGRITDSNLQLGVLADAIYFPELAIPDGPVVVLERNRKNANVIGRATLLEPPVVSFAGYLSERSTQHDQVAGVDPCEQQIAVGIPQLPEPYHVNSAT